MKIWLSIMLPIQVSHVSDPASVERIRKDAEKKIQQGLLPETPYLAQAQVQSDAERLTVEYGDYSADLTGYDGVRFYRRCRDGSFDIYESEGEAVWTGDGFSRVESDLPEDVLEALAKAFCSLLGE